MDQNIFQFIFSTFHEAFEFMRPSLSNYQEFSRALSKQIQVKENDNIQYSFDVELDRIIKNKIKQFGISGRVFATLRERETPRLPSRLSGFQPLPFTPLASNLPRFTTLPSGFRDVFLYAFPSVATALHANGT